MAMDVELQKRIFARVVVPPSGCWEWTGSSTRDGYGTMRISKRHWLVHRANFEAFGNVIHNGATLDHRCRNRICCNPDHLEAVTFRENCLRGVSFSAKNAAKTHCQHGHPLSGANLYLHKSRRQCRRCNSDAVVRYKAKKAKA